jgi:hypothetical protein
MPISCKETHVRRQLTRPRKRGAGEKDADTRAMEKKLMEQLGVIVTIAHQRGRDGRSGGAL